MKLELSDSQQRTIAAALTLLAATVIVFILYRAALLLASFVETFSGVFMPLFSAMILALLLRPIYDKLTSGRLSKVQSLIVLYAMLLVPLLLGLWALIAFMVTQVMDVIERAPTIIANVESTLDANGPWLAELNREFEISGRLKEVLATRADSLLQGLRTVLGGAVTAGGTAFAKVAGSLGWFVVPVYVGFLLLLKPIPVGKFEEYLPFLKAETRKDVIYLVRQFIELIVTFFRGQLIIAFIQGILFAVGFQLVGLKFGLLIGFSLGFLNIIPYLGSMIGLAVALPLAWLQPEGGPMLLALVLAVFAVVQVIEGYVLTPKIMGNQTGLHPMVIMVALFFWGTAFDGIIGMILAIPLTAFLVVLWQLAKTKYIRELL